jgi:hypothetical protein
MPFFRDPLDLGPQRAGALVLAPRPLDPLEKLVCREQTVELLLASEVVLAPFLLAGPSFAGGHGDRELELWNPLQQHPRQRALPLAGRAGDDEDRRARPATC